MKSRKRLLVLRILGILFTIVTIYIIIETVSKPQPTDFLARFQGAPDLNLYEETARFINSEGSEVFLTNLKGKVSVYSFVFLNCNSYCPRIMADMISLQKKLGSSSEKVQFLIFLFDDLTSKPESMKKFYKKYRITPDQFKVLTTDTESMKEFAEKLRIKYSSKNGKTEFIHSNLIAASNPDGKMLFADYGLLKGSETIIREVLAGNSGNE